MFRYKNKPQYKESGFTVIELMVVFLIIVLLSSATLILWNQQVPRRSLTIAQNELVTNIRKAQSYAVSSRNLQDGSAVKYYVVRFSQGDPSYQIHAITADGQFQTTAIETLNLPTGLVINDIYFDGVKQTYQCAFVLYSIPFGKTYFYSNQSIKCNGSIEDALETAAQSLVTLSADDNTNLSIELKHTSKDLTNTTVIHKLTGKVEPQ